MSQEDSLSPYLLKDSSHDTLIKILEKHATLDFKGTYGIEFEGPDTKPKDMISSNPSSSTSNLISIHNNWDEIDAIINSLIIASLNLPEFLKDTLRNDLRNEFLSIKKEAEENAIKSAKYSRTFPAYSGEQHLWKTITILTFSPVVLGDGGTATFIKFLCVFYPVKRDGAAALAAAPEESLAEL